MTTETALGESAGRRSLYVVANWPGGGNDRVRKILRLREEFDSLTLVTPGETDLEDEERLMRKPFPNPTGVLRLAGLHRLKGLLDRYLFFPSTSRLFTARVQRSLARRIRQDLAAGRAVTLLTTAPPHGLGLLGLYVKKRFPEVHWVNDWQDLWSYDENYFLQAPRLYRPAVRRLERRMMTRADLNLTTNARARDVLVHGYDIPPERVAFVHHHFDRSDFDVAAAEDEKRNGDAPTDAVRIGFMGTLFKPPRVPGMEVVEAIRALRAGGTNVELHIHGWVQQELQPLLKEEEGVFLHGRVTHEESVRQLSKYDYLLLFLWKLENSRVVMSIKLPHYMIVGRPILAIVPGDSAVADLVEQTGTGHVLPVDSDWREALRTVLKDRAAGDVTRHRKPEMIETFSWSSIALQWRAVLTGQRPDALPAIGAPDACTADRVHGRVDGGDEPTPQELLPPARSA